MHIYTDTHISSSYPFLCLSLPEKVRVQFKKHFPGTLPLSLSLSPTTLTIFLYLCFPCLCLSPPPMLLSLLYSLPSLPSLSPFFCGQKARMILWSALPAQTPSKADCVAGPRFCRETACLNLQPDSVPFPGPG